MPLVVNSNLASLAARRALDRTQGALKVSTQRLSSGLRINSARDDAAGLAIAMRMTSQLRGRQQALRNVNDGVSLLQVADQALASMTDRLQHVRELALQSLDGTLGAADRRSLDGDVQASLREVDRDAGGTAFNGRSLLDGSFGHGDFQIGADSADLLSVDLSANLRTAHLGAIATATSADLRTLNGSGGGGFVFAGTYTTVPIAAFDFSRPDVPLHPGSTETTGGVATNYAGAGNAAVIAVDGHAVSLASNYGSVGAVAGAIQAQLNAVQPGAYAVSQDAGLVKIVRTAAATSPTAAVSLTAVSGANAAAFAANARAAGTPASSSTHAGFAVDGHRISLDTDVGSADGLIATIQAQLDACAPGKYAVSGSAAGISIQRSPSGALPSLGAFSGTGASVFARSAAAHLTLADGDLSVQVGTAAATPITGNFSSAQSLAAAIEAKAAGVSSVHIDNDTGQLKINARQTITLSGAQASPGGDLDFAQLVNDPSGSLDDATVATSEGAQDTVLRVDAALDSLNDQRATLGSLLSRFDSISSSLRLQQSATEAARGRIVDADFAEESAGVARERVLQQAGVAVLTQANAQPSEVLALLRQ